MNITLKTVPGAVLVCAISRISSRALAVPIQLQNGTATFSQVISGGPFTCLADDSILAGVTIATQGIYSVSYSTLLNKISGLRLEAIENP
jgi:hypothetical protein